VSKPRRGDIVEVRWKDSERLNLGWASTARYLASAADPSTYLTAGYWVGRRAGSIVLALSCSPSNRLVNDSMAIPVCAVIRTTVVHRAKPRVRKALKP
jgi:hypothetical protein